MNSEKSVLILGANSDVAKECAKLYLQKNFRVMMASRNLKSMEHFIKENQLDSNKIDLLYFDAVDFASHQKFYSELPFKPNVVLYSAGFLVQNEDAFQDFDKTLQMMHTNYSGAVSILNIIAFDKSNKIWKELSVCPLFQECVDEKAILFMEAQNRLSPLIWPDFARNFLQEILR